MAKPLTGQTSTLKRINVALVKNALRLRGTASRKELAEATDLSQPTVNAIINLLQEQGEVVSRGAALSSGGRRAELYALNQEHQMAAAVFVMPEHMDYAVTDTNGAILSRGTTAVARDKDYAEQISALLQRLVSHYPNIKVAGVTFPSVVTPMGELFASSQIPYLERVDMLHQLQRQLAVPVVVENDVKLRALGYYRAELMRKTKSMVYLHVGRGLGAGVILNGRCHCGSTNFSGEIKHMPAGHRWPGKTLEEVLAETTDEEQLAEMLIMLAMNLICVMDPPYLVMGGSRITETMVERVKQGCAERLPRGVMPFFLFAEDESRYLYGGITSFALEQIDTELRIVSGPEE